MAKTIFYLAYWGAGAIISYFLPEQARFTWGFILAIVAAWAFRILRTEEREVRNG